MIGITATQAELDELLEGITMQFKKGDLVECWDYDDQDPETCEYFGFNDHVSTNFPHLARRDYGDVFGYKHCRPVRPDLKIDAPVWVLLRLKVWKPRHFAGWHQDGRMGIWAFGCTSHTTECGEKYWFPQGEYRLTPPESD